MNFARGWSWHTWVMTHMHCLVYIYEINRFAQRADAFYKSKCPSMCPSVCLSFCLSVCLSVYLFTFEVPFKCLFAPIFQSWISKVFRDSVFLGKSNGKKWSQIWKLLLIKGVKLPRQKKFVLGRTLPYWAGFFCHWCFSLCLTVFWSPLPKVQCQNFLDFLNPWGKVMERSCLRFENFCS